MVGDQEQLKSVTDIFRKAGNAMRDMTETSRYGMSQRRVDAAFSASLAAARRRRVKAARHRRQRLVAQIAVLLISALFILVLVIF